MAAKNKFLNAMKMPSIDDMFSSEADRQRESGDLVTYADEGWYVEKTTFASDTAAYNGNYHIHKDSGLTESQDQVAKGKACVIRSAPIWTVPYGTGQKPHRVLPITSSVWAAVHASCPALSV